MGNKPRVLVVDDDARITDLYCAWLSAWGYDATPAVGGAAAMELIGQGDWALVLCDAKMPDVSGLDVRRSLSQKSPDTPFILITGCGKEDARIAEIMDTRIDCYMEKPVDFSVLRKVIASVLKH